MKEETLIHVRVGYEEGVESKKDILSIERDLLRILKILKKYSLLRKEEINIRLRMQNKIKILKMNLGRLNNTLPKIKIPDILRKNETKEERLSRLKQESKEKDLESQLRDIQERLRKLG